jgi:arylsulfatase
MKQLLEEWMKQQGDTGASMDIDYNRKEKTPARVAGKGKLLSALGARNQAVYIKEGWIRDPYIYLAPDGYYYLTGTTPNPGDPRENADIYNLGLSQFADKVRFQPSIVGYKIRVWRSSDLTGWEYLGEPFSLDKGYWAQKDPGAFIPGSGKEWLLWAPEIFFDNERWIMAHTSPSPVKGGANLIVAGANPAENHTFPMGDDMQNKHDPSLFKDDDGTWYLVWGNAFIAPLKPGFNGLAAKPKRIDPSDRVIGHEGATIRKIGKKYVLFGTAWSTDKGRKGTYNLYYCTANSVCGPYGERRFAGRFLGHGTPFMDKNGQWWCTAFFNANVPPLSNDEFMSKNLDDNAYTINEQGVTLVPLDVNILPGGDVEIHSPAPRYKYPGPEEVQKFNP